MIRQTELPFPLKRGLKRDKELAPGNELPASPHVLITGSRDWDDVETIREELAKLPSDAIIVHGGARGADLIAGSIWKSRGGKVIETKADWERFGKAAGPIRNKQMLDEFPLAYALAFRKGLSSKGTQHMVSLLRAKGVPTLERWADGLIL